MPQTPEPQESGWHERLDAAMEARRVDLGLNWKQLAGKAGIAYETLRAIRRGTFAPSAVNQRRLENALGWRPGSIAAVMKGGVPELADQAAPQSRPSGSAEDPRVAAMVTLLASLPPEAQAEVLERMRRLGPPGTARSNPRGERNAG
ncbi:MAG TPA: helix-turn-helix transcriptional regulator [Streptomyces sp.]|nr:helix-turn-helix transcriptional regulator [Streptomyces sp.]